MQKQNLYQITDFFNSTLLKKKVQPISQHDLEASDFRPQLFTFEDLRLTFALGISRRVRLGFWKKWAAQSKIKAQYSLLRDIKNSNQPFINADAGRSKAQITQQQKSELINVLRAYSNFDPEVGYCQGLNFLAMMLIDQLQDQSQRQDLAFSLLVRLLWHLKHRTNFTNKCAKVFQITDVIFNQLKQIDSKLYNHFVQSGMPLNTFFVGPIVSFFTSSKSQLRVNVLDILLLGQRHLVQNIILKFFQLQRKNLLQVSGVQLIKLCLNPLNQKSIQYWNCQLIQLS